MTKRRVLISCIVIAVLLCVVSSLLACNAFGNHDGDGAGDSVYTASDIRYVSEKDAEVAVVSGRKYTKTNKGTAAVALAYINGYTGPVLVGTSQSAVSYIYNYNGAKVVNDYGTVTVDGQEWYYSKNIGFMSGNYLSFKEKGPIYCSKQTSAEEVAKEVIGLLDNTLFAATKISTVEELMSIENSDDNYVLDADIDLSSVKNWKPIEGFKGSLNGGGYKISNLTISSVNDADLGLFKVLEGTVRNLLIENAQITSRGDAGKAGIVAGTNKGTIKNVIVSGVVNAPYYNDVGGIVGFNDGILTSCENQANAVGKDNVGGICGSFMMRNNSVSDGNINNGEIKGANNVGGCYGLITGETVKTDSNFSHNLQQNENKNSVSGKENVGGIIGKAVGAGKYSSNWSGLGYFYLSAMSNTGEISGLSNAVGGIVGYGQQVAEISVSENIADITGGNYVGGFAGYSEGTTIKLAENNSTITGKGYVGGIAGYCGIVWNATNNGSIVSTAIIVEDGVSRSYVGGIAGYCLGINDSKNNSDIVVSNATSYVGGLAGYAKISNSDQLNNNENTGKIVGKDSVGGIVGMVAMSVVKTDNNFTYHFENNKNEGTVNGTDHVGGLFGTMIGAGKYSANWSGLGYFDFSICENTGEVFGSGDGVGGLVGYAERIATITVCTNTGDVTGSNYVGGYVGRAEGANIKLATNNNIITGKGYVGGIAGKAGKIESSTNNGQIVTTGVIVEDNTGRAYVGGIAGYATGVVDCKNNSDITVNTNGEYTGGIAGYVHCYNDNEITENENYGAVNGANYTGGIAGYISTQAEKTDKDFTRKITNNKNYANVSGKSYVGGISGYCFGAGKFSSSWYGVCYIEMTYCVNEGEIKGTGNVGGIVGGHTRLKTDANIMDTNTTSYGNKLG